MTTHIKLAKRLDAIPEYVFAKLAKEVEKVEEESGKKVLNFGPGNPDVPPSPKYIKKLQEFINEDQAYKYPGYGAIPELSKAITSWYSKRFGVTLTREEIQPLLGAKDGITHLPLALLDEDDEVLIPDPGYPAFTEPALMIGASPVYYNLSQANNFKIRF